MPHQDDKGATRGNPQRDQAGNEPVRHPGDQGRPNAPQVGEQICPECRGTGRRGETATCLTCGGSGRIVQIVGDA